MTSKGASCACWRIGYPVSDRSVWSSRLARLAQFELRVAAVAVVSQARYDQIDPNDNLGGAPELVIEIKSPSNTDRKLRELASLTLANGSWECWLVDPDEAWITVVHRDGSISRFHAPHAIPLATFGGEALPIAEIFG